MLMRGSRNRRLRVERLEEKHMLNGTVTALVAGGSLVLIGDAHGNQIEVAPGAAAGDIEIKGTDGTTMIRVGHAAPAVDVIVHGVTRNITTNLGGGDDGVTIGGAEDFAVPLILKGSVIVVDALGDNYVAVTNATLGGMVSITTGAGDDGVFLGFAAIGVPATAPVTAKLGVSINAGSGMNVVSVDDVKTGFFTLITGSNIDTITIDTVTAKYAVVSTGSGADTLTVDDTTIAKDFVLNMGLGNDTVNLGLTLPDSVGRFAILNGGPGKDTLNASKLNNFNPAKLFIISFETVNIV